MIIEFKHQLSQLRRQRGFSQEELAQQLYLSRQTISKWEQGELTPDLATLVKIAEIFNVGLDELVFGSTKKAPARDPHKSGHQHRPMNGWEFLASYWWLLFPLMGMLGWLIRG